jgi:hypothetical protein
VQRRIVDVHRPNDSVRDAANGQCDRSHQASQESPLGRAGVQLRLKVFEGSREWELQLIFRAMEGASCECELQMHVRGDLHPALVISQTPLRNLGGIS